MSLGNILQQIEKRIDAPDLKHTLSELRSKMQELTASKEAKHGGEVIKELSKEKAANILYILNEQRKGIEGIMKMHLQNAHDVEVLNKGLKELTPNLTTISESSMLMRDQGLMQYRAPFRGRDYNLITRNDL